MASLDTFRVVVEGETLPGFDRPAVLVKVANLTRRDVAFADKLLSGRAVTVKRDVDRPTAQRYYDALTGIGVACRLELELLGLDDDALESATTTDPSSASLKQPIDAAKAPEAARELSPPTSLASTSAITESDGARAEHKVVTANTRLADRWHAALESVEQTQLHQIWQSDDWYAKFESTISTIDDDVNARDQEALYTKYAQTEQVLESSWIGLHTVINELKAASDSNEFLDDSTRIVDAIAVLQKLAATFITLRVSVAIARADFNEPCEHIWTTDKWIARCWQAALYSNDATNNGVDKNYHLRQVDRTISRIERGSQLVRSGIAFLERTKTAGGFSYFAEGNESLSQLGDSLSTSEKLSTLLRDARESGLSADAPRVYDLRRGTALQVHANRILAVDGLGEGAQCKLLVSEDQVGKIVRELEDDNVASGVKLIPGEESEYEVTISRNGDSIGSRRGEPRSFEHGVAQRYGISADDVYAAAEAELARQRSIWFGRSFVQARSLLEEAARLGHPDAQKRLTELPAQ